MQTVKTVHEAFVRNYLHASNCEYDKADGSVGLPHDCWHVDTETLANMLCEYLRLLAIGATK